MVNVRKRGNSYQYYFEIAPVDGKRKQKVKSGFKTKSEAYNEGIKAYNEYNSTGHSFTPKTMSYSDYLDYWMKEHCEINSKDITIRGRKQYWHHYDEANIKTEQKTDRNCAITPVKIGTEFKFKIYFNDIKKENLDELISVINLNYDDKHDLCHKIGKGKPLGLGSCKLKVEEVYIKDIRKENDILKYDMKNYDSYFNEENTKLAQVSLKQLIDINTIPMKEALRIYDFNYISKFYEGVKVQYPVAERKKDDNSMNWFMLNKSTDLKNSYIVMVLPRIIDCIDENNQDNIKEVKLKIKDEVVGKTKGLIHPKYKI